MSDYSYFYSSWSCYSRWFGWWSRWLASATFERISVPSFLSTLAAFLSLVTNGETPAEICPLFFGARLIAISKKGCGVRPIGCTLRCLVAKIASGIVHGDMSALLALRQLGFGVKGVLFMLLVGI